MKKHGNKWLYMVYMAIHGRQVHGNTRLYIAIHNNTWQNMAILGITWLYMAIHGNTW